MTAKLQAALRLPAEINRQAKIVEEKRAALAAASEAAKHRMAAAMDALRTAEIRDLRGIANESELPAVRASVAAARYEAQEIADQSAAAEAATKELDAERFAAQQDVDRQYAKLSDRLFASIAAEIRGDRKLRAAILEAYSVIKYACRRGAVPDWAGIIADIFPAPDEAECRVALARAMKKHRLPNEAGDVA